MIHRAGARTPLIFTIQAKARLSIARRQYSRVDVRCGRCCNRTGREREGLRRRCLVFCVICEENKSKAGSRNFNGASIACLVALDGLDVERSLKATIGLESVTK